MAKRYPTPAELNSAPASHVDSTNGHPIATITASGFLSAADQAKLNGVEDGATADQAWADIPDKPTTFPPDAHNHDTLYPAGNPSAPTDGYVWTYDAATGGWLPKALPGSSAAVDSVDGRTGTVTLSDLYAGLIHKSRHATGGADAIVPADISAAPASHVNSTDGHPVATTTASGFQSAADKTKLNAAVEIGAIDNGPQIFNSITVNTTVTKSSDLRGVGGVPSYAKGIWYSVYISAQSTSSQVGVSSADVTPDTSQRIVALAAGFQTGSGMVRLGTTPGNEGKIAVVQIGTPQTSGFGMWVSGWWS